jgi:hypothetical protein
VRRWPSRRGSARYRPSQSQLGRGVVLCLLEGVTQVSFLPL